MNMINNYVETVFMKLPDMQELMDLKQNILNNMEKKYKELLSDGLSDTEAIGLVISDFEDVDEFISMKKSLGVSVGFGVILCGIAASMIIFGIHINAVIN